MKLDAFAPHLLLAAVLALGCNVTMAAGMVTGNVDGLQVYATPSAQPGQPAPVPAPQPERPQPNGAPPQHAL
ncbi:hypothetical protein AGMMS49960_06070 [Betaproteobacteria bacterium]|nr:hypothetical protein AGMMS49543_01570 [Betaproteobacteria bacterium]GHT99799.1 hypothetical protein AGMMS49960_06070 [Betaproteobacteria bacterium]GHU19122.1 hypothetical protein AGMMS50243_10470 [Betaproteobacteria bacterium]